MWKSAISGTLLLWHMRQSLLLRQSVANVQWNLMHNTRLPHVDDNLIH